MATIIWTQADIDTLKAALASGVKEVEYDGPPRRRVEYQDLDMMRELLAEMVKQVQGNPTVRATRFAKGFRSTRFE